MKAVCCIPTIRPDLLPGIRAQAEADGWTVLVEEDRERRGSNPTRNLLLDRALDLGADIIRFADDDDELMPHREVAEAALQHADVAYFDFCFSTAGQPHVLNSRWTGDLEQDLNRAPAPWAWVARASALAGLRPVFNPAQPCVQGGWAMVKLIEAGLRIEHVPVLAYHWRHNRVSPRVGEHPAFAEEVRRFKAYIANRLL